MCLASALPEGSSSSKLQRIANVISLVNPPCTAPLVCGVSLCSYAVPSAQRLLRAAGAGAPESREAQHSSACTAKVTAQKHASGRLPVVLVVWVRVEQWHA